MDEDLDEAFLMPNTLVVLCCCELTLQGWTPRFREFITRTMIMDTAAKAAPRRTKKEKEKSMPATPAVSSFCFWGRDA